MEVIGRRQTPTGRWVDDRHAAVFSNKNRIKREVVTIDSTSVSIREKLRNVHADHEHELTLQSAGGNNTRERDWLCRCGTIRGHWFAAEVWAKSLGLTNDRRGTIVDGG